MGWAVGVVRERFIGYGVPALCDHPDCDKLIDRGLAYRCGEGRVDGCELYFCSDHLTGHVEEDDGAYSGWVCSRCYYGGPPYDPKPDVPAWINHVLTDPTWAEWRRDHPDRVESMKASLRPPLAPELAENTQDDADAAAWLSETGPGTEGWANRG